MGKRREGSNRRGLLPTANGAGGDEETGVFAPETARLPLPTGLVPEGLPLGWEVAVASGDAEEETVVGLCSPLSAINVDRTQAQREDDITYQESWGHPGS